MNKILLVFINLLLTIAAAAQLTITVQVPETGMLLKSQLWNAVISNSYSDSKQVFIGLTLSNAATGEPVMTGTTSKLFIPTGVTQVLESNLSPITYDYLSSDISDRNPEGYLPAGSYTACYTLFLIDENNGSPVAEQCTPLIIEPVSPPILNIPFNKQIIRNPYPQFSWTPPTPLEIFSNLNYDFVLVEVGEEQSPADAIQQNLPIYSMNTNDIFLNYPSSSLNLDTGKTYAWQITAKNDEQFAAQSEIWTFSLSDSFSQNPGQNKSQYIKLKRTLDASLSVAIDNLLVYYENDEDTTVQYSIYDIDKNSSADSSTEVVTSGVLTVHSGINLISLPLEQVSQLADNKQYLFQLYNSKSETWSTKFIFYKKD